MTAREEEEARIAQEILDRTGKDPFAKEDEGKVDESGKMRPPVKKKKKKGQKDPVPEPFVPVKKAALKKEQEVDIEKNFLAKCEMDFIPGLDTEDLEIVMPAFYEKPFFEYAEEVKEKKRQEIREERERLRKLKEMQDKINEEKNGGKEEDEKKEEPKKEGPEEEEEIEIPEPVAPKPPPPPPDDPDMIIGPRPIVPYSCCFILDHEGPTRIKIHEFVTKPAFDGFIMAIILISSVALAAEDPIDETNIRNVVLQYLDYGFTAVFATEMILKMFDLGIVCHPGSYFRDLWNALDFVVVSCALFSIAFSGSEEAAKNLATMKSLKVLRVLRPLKTINRIPELKAVFDCVINSLKNVFNIMVVYMLFMFIFSVIGVQLFSGKFFYCNDIAKETEKECQGQFYNYDEGYPVIVDREWSRWEFHYDNVIFAFLTLFTIQTGEGWPQILEHSLDVTSENHGPKKSNKLDYSIFYIVYFVVFPFFFVNIFVALIIITFQEQGEQALAEAEVDKNQKSCMEFALNAKPMRLYVPTVKSGLSYRCYQLCTSPPFENFILLLITINTVTLMMKVSDHFCFIFQSMDYFLLILP